MLLVLMPSYVLLLLVILGVYKLLYQYMYYIRVVNTKNKFRTIFILFSDAFKKYLSHCQ